METFRNIITRFLLTLSEGFIQRFSAQNRYNKVLKIISLEEGFQRKLECLGGSPEYEATKWINTSNPSNRSATVVENMKVLKKQQ